MQQHSIYEVTRTIYVIPSVAGIHLDYSLGEELPLFAPLTTDSLVYGIGYNSAERRKAFGLPAHETAGRTYRRWFDMLTRCYKSGATAYAGCTVCRKWHDFQEFADCSLLSHMHMRPTRSWTKIFLTHSTQSTRRNSARWFQE